MRAAGSTPFAAALLLAALLLACRDGVPPFVTDVPPFGTDAMRQLTFGHGLDRDPRWSAGSDSVYYHTDLFTTLPSMRGALIAVPRTGGAGVPLLADVQRTPKMLATPVPSPAGDRIAYFEMVNIDVPSTCAQPPAGPGGSTEDFCLLTQPLLDAAVLRVRRTVATQAPTDDPSVAVTFAGSAASLRYGQAGPHIQHAHPFQQLHRSEHVLLFRPSWSPDGQRLVFSDGLGLYTWTVGSAAAVAVPNSRDGVSPAWSPDGSWIAFTVLQRGDSVVRNCSCGGATHRRTQYELTARQLVVMKPDGSDRLVLGAGEEPAWTPDASQIYYAAGRIMRIPARGGTATAVPNTERGRAPAVSPDGRWLAFSRWKLQLLPDSDIWVTSLAP
jgi:hypothetical protein